MRDDDHVGDVKASGEEESEAIADDRADVGLNVGGSEAGIDRGRTPDLHRQEIKGAEESAGVVDGKNGRDLPTPRLMRLDRLPTAGDGQQLLVVHSFRIMVTNPRQNEGGCCNDQIGGLCSAGRPVTLIINHRGERSIRSKLAPMV